MNESVKQANAIIQENRQGYYIESRRIRVEPYYSVKQLVENDIITPIFASILTDKCIDPHCQSPIYRNAGLTRALCINPECPQHMKYKAEQTVKYLGLKGIAENTCYDYIITNKLKSHLEIIPLLFNEKPTLELWEVAKLCFIPDISDEWKTVLAGQDDITEVKLPYNLKDYVSLIQDATKYFNIKKERKWKAYVDISVHGYCSGYGNGEQFAKYCNSLTGNAVYTTAKSSTTRSCSFVVTDQTNDLGCGRIKKAIQYGTSVITPQEYILYLARVTAGFTNQE